MKIFTLVLFTIIPTFLYANEESCIAITSEKLCVQLEWQEGPFLGKYSKNTVKFLDLSKKNNKPSYRSPSGSVQFFAWMVMSGHEHGTRPVQTKVIGPGIYENSDIFYIDGMTGTWQFKVKLGSEAFILHSLDI